MSADPVEAPQVQQDGLAQNSFEASLAPREGELLYLPFDQYGRMRIVQNIMNTLYTETAFNASGDTNTDARLRVLDVGGYPGVLRHFLREDYYDLSVIDVVPDDGSIPGYRQGSGLELPHEDASFDVVTALDTLEHIPAPDRDRFLSEIMRVARYAAVVINPVQSVEADLAEETLNEYIRWILDAQQEQLAEHRDYGLPSFTAMISAFEHAGWHTTHFPTANVHNWLLMMIAKHYLISLRDERATAFERTLDRFYNLTFSNDDHAEPGYRGVLVAVRPGLEAGLARITADYHPVVTSESSNVVRLQLTQVLMSMLDLKTANHEDRLLREQMERRDKHIAGMETRIALQDVHITSQEAHVASLTEELEQTRQEYSGYRAQMATEFDNKQRYIARLEQEQRNKDEHILYLEKLLQGIEAGRVMRLTRTLSRFLGRH